MESGVAGFAPATIFLTLLSRVDGRNGFAMNSTPGWFSRAASTLTRNKNDWDFGEFSTHQVCKLDAI
jgi:hypothetical protein